MAPKPEPPPWACVCAWCGASVRTGTDPPHEGCCDRCRRLYEDELRDMRIAMRRERRQTRDRRQ